MPHSHEHSEDPIKQARYLAEHREVIFDTRAARRYLQHLLIEIDALNAAISEECLGEYGDVSLVHHIRAMATKHRDRLLIERLG